MSVQIVPLETWWHLEHSIQLARQALSALLLPQNLRTELCHSDAQYYVALINGGVKGFAGWKKTGLGPDVYEFPWCVVHPDYQMQGIGRALTERRIADIKERRGKLILLTTPRPEIYERYGFYTRTVIPNAWANFLMTLSI